jgi:predicted permease
MILAAFSEVLLPVLVVVAAGYGLRRRFEIDVRSLNRVSMYLLGPALIFTTLVSLELAGGEALRITLASASLCLGMGAITWLVGRALRLAPAQLAGLLLCTMFMNSGNYGLPTTRFAFGDAGFERALLFFIAQTILAQVLAIPIANAGAAGWRTAAGQIARMPQIYAVVLGLAARFSGLELPARQDVVGALYDGVALLAQAALPLLLLLLGMQLAQEVVIEAPQLTVLAVALRLVVSPLLAWGIAVALQLDDLATRVVVLEASMPTAVNMVLYSLEFNAQPRFVAGVVVASTALSLISVAVILSIIR